MAMSFKKRIKHKSPGLEKLTVLKPYERVAYYKVLWIACEDGIAYRKGRENCFRG